MIPALIAVAALAAILAIPVRAIVLWRNGSLPQVTVCWLFLSFRVYPQKEKPKGQKKPKKARKAPKKKPKMRPSKEPEEFAGQLAVLVDLLAAVKGAGGFLLRHFCLHKVRLDIIVAKGDAARTAIAYGRVNGLVYGAYAAAKNFLRIGNPEISIRPNFTAEDGDALLEIGGRLSPLSALGAALLGGGIFLGRLLRRMAREKRTEQKNDIQGEI